MNINIKECTMCNNIFGSLKISHFQNKSIYLFLTVNMALNYENLTTSNYLKGIVFNFSL